ncbi:MAG TPA: hypothetical protein VNS63_03560 [Blastocatellia bacterium]|nr:hypothetical protein [Blastocatellia bacterium]
MAETTNVATQQRIDESGERSADQIRQNIAAQRETIAETVDKLGDRIHQTFDWREYVAEYPAVALGLAAGTGILLSAIFKREPTPQERILDAIADMTEDFTDRISGVAGDVIQRKLVSGRTVKAAASALVAKAAIDFAKRKLGESLAGRTVEKQDIRTREVEALAQL